MKAFAINKYGNSSPLVLTELATPVIKEHEVLVQVHAASLNPLDDKIKTGAFKIILPYKLPLVLGHDLAGVIVAVGSAVQKWKTGDEVYARAADFSIGSLAEYIAVNENDLALKPANLSMVQAAAVPLVALTAWQALIEKGHLKKDQRVFIQAGSGGVGTMTIQLARHLGLYIATTASARNSDLLKALGANEVIDYHTQDFERVLSHYDFVLNSQDNKTLKKSINILKQGGKVVSLSGPPTPDFAKAAGLSWILRTIVALLSFGIRKQAKNKQVDYSFLFMKASGSQLEQITQLIESGVLQPIVDKVFSFENSPEALDYVASGRAKGKVVVKIR